MRRQALPHAPAMCVSMHVCEQAYSPAALILPMRKPRHLTNLLEFPQTEGALRSVWCGQHTSATFCVRALFPLSLPEPVMAMRPMTFCECLLRARNRNRAKHLILSEVATAVLM